MNDRPQTVTLSLIAHTNVGKTTLARTLLRKDIGQVMDKPHVTDISEAFAMMQSAEGDTLRLWDTPGFGDTARLLRRLKGSGNPLGWLLTQVWDRIADRPLWCSQQAVRNVQEQADVVLYLVNAAEQPGQSGYIDMELEILTWIKVPVIALLNQTGPPRTSDLEAAELAAWENVFRKFPIVHRTLRLDAFARCWVQENSLLEIVSEVLPPAKTPALDRLSAAWRQRNLSIFEKSMGSIGRQLAETWIDREILGRQSLTRRLKALLTGWEGRQPAATRETAMALLAERLDQRIRDSMNELIELHGLEGRAAGEILQRLRDDYAAKVPVHEGISALLGGALTGALTGLATDIAAGGLTFGGGALVGALLGAAGAGGLAKGYNLVRGESEPSLRWSKEFCFGLARSSLLRYLAVAHYGRGRGEYREMEHPRVWQQQVAACVAAHEKELADLWENCATGIMTETARRRFIAVMRDCVRTLLTELYPEAGNIIPAGPVAE